MRQFADVVRHIGSDGEFYDLVTATLAEVTQAVIQSRKSGGLTLTLKVRPNGETSVFISGDVKAKVPQKTHAEALFFTTVDGDLVRDDPRQEKLPLREVTNEPKEMKNV